MADAWALGQEAIAAYAAAHGLGKRRARAFIEARWAVGRKASKAAGARP